MAHFSHIRVTPYEFDYDLSGVLKYSEKYVVVAEKGAITFKPHFHIAMYTDACKKTLDNTIKRDFHIPSEGKGKASKYFAHKYDEYQDPSPEYVCKDLFDSSGTHLVPQHVKGFTPAEVQEFIKEGHRKYGPGSDYHRKKYPQLYRIEPANSTPVEGPKSEATSKGEWDKLLEAYEDAFYSQKRTNDTMKDIEKWIKHYYLARSRPIPRAGDIARYRYSLWAIVVKDEIDVDAADSHENNIYSNI